MRRGGASRVSNKWYVPVACTRLEFHYSTGYKPIISAIGTAYQQGNLVTADAVFSRLGLWVVIFWQCWKRNGNVLAHCLWAYPRGLWRRCFRWRHFGKFCVPLHNAMKYHSKSHIIAQRCLRLSCTNFDQILQNSLKFCLLWISCVQFQYNYLSIPEEIHH